LFVPAMQSAIWLPAFSHTLNGLSWCVSMHCAFTASRATRSAERTVAESKTSVGTTAPVTRLTANARNVEHARPSGEMVP
jgi:hypothetical protein